MFRAYLKGSVGTLIRSWYTLLGPKEGSREGKLKSEADHSQPDQPPPYSLHMNPQQASLQLVEVGARFILTVRTSTGILQYRRGPRTTHALATALRSVLPSFVYDPHIPHPPSSQSCGGKKSSITFVATRRPFLADILPAIPSNTLPVSPGKLFRSSKQATRSVDNPKTQCW